VGKICKNLNDFGFISYEMIVTLKFIAQKLYRRIKASSHFIHLGYSTSFGCVARTRIFLLARLGFRLYWVEFCSPFTVLLCGFCHFPFFYQLLFYL